MDIYFKYIEKDVFFPTNHRVTRKEQCHNHGFNIPAKQVMI